MEGNERRTAHGEEAGAEAWQRLSAYAYLSAPERLEYVAVMRVFCGTLLADLSVPDLLAKLAETDGPGAALDAETLTRRLEELVRWGNLLRSTHTVRTTSIAEYQRSRSRYQLSKLGERVQRDADEVLAGADAAREVSSELLALVGDVACIGAPAADRRHVADQFVDAGGCGVDPSPSGEGEL